MDRCKELANLYGAYLFGDTTEEETERVRRHLEQCPECRIDVEGRQKIISAIPDTFPKLSGEDRQRIAWSVKDSLRQQKVRRPFWQMMMPLAHNMSLVMLVVAVAGVTFYRVQTMNMQVPAYLPPPSSQLENPVPPGPQADRVTTPDFNTEEPPAPNQVQPSPSIPDGYISRSSPGSATSRFHLGSRFDGLSDSWRQIDWYGKEDAGKPEEETKDELKDQTEESAPAVVPNMENATPSGDALSDPSQSSDPDEDQSRRQNETQNDKEPVPADKGQ